MQRETVNDYVIGDTCLNPAYGGKLLISPIPRPIIIILYGPSVSVTQGFTERGQLQ